MAIPNPVDVAKAKAFSLWVKNVIGEEPQIITSDEGYVEVNFTPEQREALMHWLDSQVSQMWTPGTPHGLKINFGQVLFPWALRYVIPTAGAVFLAGYLTQGFQKFSKRFSR